MDHFFGLFHTSEKDVQMHDILEDTPECDLETQDANGDGYISLDECQGLGDTNLMFWNNGRNIRQTELTPNQAHVVHHSPIAR